MPTGPQHWRKEEVLFDENLDQHDILAPCRCMIGRDHDAEEVVIGEYVDEDESDDDDESLSASDAALIWGSKGRDEDYMFGYSEDELRSHLE
jgi:hypothetical protein